MASSVPYGYYYPQAGYPYAMPPNDGQGAGPSPGGHFHSVPYSHIPPYHSYNPAWQQQPLSAMPKQLTQQTQTNESTNPKGAWVIWSRRPHDPSLAPAIIFSPGSKPPPSVVAQALDLPLPVQEESSQSNSTASSSAVTETTDTPTVPGSPLSSSTSISAGTPSKAPEEPPVWVEVGGDDQEELAWEEHDQDEPKEEEEPKEQPPEPQSPPPPKKSWASLLKPGAASTSRLPTSSVVGFSIPASSSLSQPTPSTTSNNESPLFSTLTSAKKQSLITLLTTPLIPSTPPKIRSKGLVNTGNMCFANSVLQVLIYCPPFYHLFSELGKLLPPPAQRKPLSGNSKSTTPLVDATIEFLKEFDEDQSSKMSIKDAEVKGKGKGKEKENLEPTEGDQNTDEWDDSFIPTYVYDALKEKKRFDHMRGGHQEDAEEFFGFYLDTLEEELLSILNALLPSPSSPAKTARPIEEKEEEEPSTEDDGWLEVGKKNRTVVTRTIKAAESPISRIFGGKFRSTLKAPQQKDSVIVEDWRSLRLDIQREQIYTIHDALSYISHPQSVQMTNPTRGTIEASQQVLVDALPPVLVLHMKRFCYDKDLGGVGKVLKGIKVHPELEIPKEIMTLAAKKAQAKYKLFGVIYHHGVSASGGHYTLDVLHPTRFPVLPSPTPGTNTRPFREGWIRIDDELVSDVSAAEDVFGGDENSAEANENSSLRCAYLLFYRRVR